MLIRSLHHEHWFICLQVTPDQIKWKFNRLNTKYKECIDNNNKSGRAHITFEYYDQFEQIFYKEKDVSASRTFSSSIFETNERKGKHESLESKVVSKDKKLKLHVASCSKNSTLFNESPKHKTSPVATVKKNSKNQYLQSLEVLQNIQENQMSRDDKMTKYLKIKEKDMELKKKAIEVREMETQVKKDLASEKLKFNEKRHQDWLKMEKFKCKLLEKLMKNHNDSEESD